MFTDTTTEPTRVIKYDDISFSLRSVTDPVLVAWLTLHKVPLPNENYFSQNAKKELLFFLRDIEGNRWGYQARSFIVGKPKYTTHLIKNSEVSWFGVVYHAKTVVITEDYTSAFRVWYDAGTTTLALLKTSISNTTINELAGIQPLKIIVWLDPDIPGQTASKKLATRLRVILPASIEVKVIHTDEPKNLTPQQVREVLDGL